MKGEKNMSIYERFTEAMKKKMKERFGNGYEVTSAIIVKDDAEPCHNLLIRKRDSNINLTIPLTVYFYEYMNTPAYLDDVVDEISIDLKKYNCKEIKKEVCEGRMCISKLPDETFFYVNNGHWQGFVTTENGNKVCYAGASKKNPTKEYVRRFIPDKDYELVIEIL